MSDESESPKELVRVTQVGSAIGAKPKTRKTLRALGLRRVGASRLHARTPSLDGMLRRVGHLVEVETRRIGAVEQLTPDLSEATKDVHYELPTGRTGTIRVTPKGEPYRI